MRILTLIVGVVVGVYAAEAGVLNSDIFVAAFNVASNVVTSVIEAAPAAYEAVESGITSLAGESVQ